MVRLLEVGKVGNISPETIYREGLIERWCIYIAGPLNLWPGFPLHTKCHRTLEDNVFELRFARNVNRWPGNVNIVSVVYTHTHTLSRPQSKPFDSAKHALYALLMVDRESR